MKMARAPQEQIDALWKFLRKIDSLMDAGESVQLFIDKNWRKVATVYERILFGYQTLIENCCDQTQSTLEWKPEIEAAIVSYRALKSGG